MKDNESHPFVSLVVSGLLIPGISSLMILITSYTIKTYVRSDYATVLVVLAAVVISLCAFITAGVTRKNYTGKAFNSKKDFGRRLLVMLIVAAVFSLGAVWGLAAFISNNAPVFVTIDGHSYTDNEILFRYFVSWMVLYCIILAISQSMVHGG